MILIGVISIGKVLRSCSRTFFSSCQQNSNERTKKSPSNDDVDEGVRPDAAAA